MLFYSFFKSLVGKDVVVELKNDLSICGTLHSVDQYLNIKLTDISVTDPDKHPHMTSVKSCFMRGSLVRYVQLPSEEVDTQLLQVSFVNYLDTGCGVISFPNFRTLQEKNLHRTSKFKIPSKCRLCYRIWKTAGKSTKPFFPKKIKLLWYDLVMIGTQVA